MGWDHPVDMPGRQPEVFDHAEQARYRVRGSGVDDGEPVALTDQIAGGEAVAVEPGLDAEDVVGKGLVVGDRHGGSV